MDDEKFMALQRKNKKFDIWPEFWKVDQHLLIFFISLQQISDYIKFIFIIMLMKLYIKYTHVSTLIKSFKKVHTSTALALFLCV